MYTYDAAGIKLRKTVNGVTTDYAGSFIYENNQLQFFSQPEGFVEANGSSFNYVYQYKDHLGNIRLNYWKNPITGTLQIKEENNYYPFGLKHQGYNNNIITEHKYKYNGKEIQQELGLNMYDYGARNYDPALGRWFVIDAFAEKAPGITPYRYAFNNPISIIDPDGNQENEPCDMGGNCSSVTIEGMKGGGSFTFGSSGNVKSKKSTKKYRFLFYVRNKDGSMKVISPKKFKRLAKQFTDNGGTIGELGSDGSSNSNNCCQSIGYSPLLGVTPTFDSMNNQSRGGDESEIIQGLIFKVKF